LGFAYGEFPTSPDEQILPLTESEFSSDYAADDGLRGAENTQTKGDSRRGTDETCDYPPPD